MPPFHRSRSPFSRLSEYITGLETRLETPSVYNQEYDQLVSGEILSTIIAAIIRLRGVANKWTDAAVPEDRRDLPGGRIDWDMSELIRRFTFSNTAIYNPVLSDPQ
jgi:hypothetical protein